MVIFFFFALNYLRNTGCQQYSPHHAVLQSWIYFPFLSILLFSVFLLIPWGVHLKDSDKTATWLSECDDNPVVPFAAYMVTDIMLQSSKWLLSQPHWFSVLVQAWMRLPPNCRPQIFHHFSNDFFWSSSWKTTFCRALSNVAFLLHRQIKLFTANQALSGPFYPLMEPFYPGPPPVRGFGGGLRHLCWFCAVSYLSPNRRSLQRSPLLDLLLA